MSSVEVGILGVLFIICVTMSVAVTLNMLLPTSNPAVGYPICERETWP